MASADRIRVLGQFALLRDGHVLLDDTAPLRGGTRLVKALALAPGHVMLRDELCELLWPEYDVAASANAFYKAVHALRARLAEIGIARETIDIANGVVTLARGIEVDLDLFHAASSSAVSERTIAGWQRVLALYTGDLLPLDIYAPWTSEAREAARATAQHARVELAKLHTAAGGFDEAERLLVQATQADHLDEAASRELMRARGAAGARDRGLREYRRLRKVLSEELGVAPSEETEVVAATLHDRTERRNGAHNSAGIRYTETTDGVRIAYATHGKGTPLIWTPILPWGHLEEEWAIPQWRALIERVAHHRMVVRYDGRGTGNSQREVDDFSVDAQVRDLAAVVDQLGLARFDLLVCENVGPAALTFVERFPSRVRRIVSWGMWASGPRFAAVMATPDWRQMMATEYEQYLELVSTIVAGSDAVMAPDIARWLNASSSRETIDDYWSVAKNSDVSALLGRIEQPVLGVMRRDVAVPSRGLADEVIAALPNARMIQVPGDALHYAAGDAEPLAQVIDEFLDAADDPLGMARPRFAAAEPPQLLREVVSRDGSRIAYTTHGSGHALVVLPFVPWGNLTSEWEIPEWRAWIARIGRGRMVVRYECRGSGQSHAVGGDVTVKRQTEDLAAVIDALEVDCVDLFVGQNAGAPAAHYAVRHPGRVRRMICWDTWADGGAFAAAHGAGGLTQMMQNEYELFADATGRSVVGFGNELLGAKVAGWLKATPVSTVARYWSVAAETNIIDLLPHLDIPVLGLAPQSTTPTDRDHRLLREFLSRIPGARLAQLDDAAFHPIAGDINEQVRVIDAFLNEPESAAAEATTIVWRRLQRDGHDRAGQPAPHATL